MKVEVVRAVVPVVVKEAEAMAEDWAAAVTGPQTRQMPQPHLRPMLRQRPYP